MFKKFNITLLAMMFLSISLFARTGLEIAKDIGVNPNLKAKSQWVRIFKKERKMKKYGIDKLNASDKTILLDFCKKYAADSDSPTIPGM